MADGNATDTVATHNGPSTETNATAHGKSRKWGKPPKKSCEERSEKVTDDGMMTETVPETETLEAVTKTAKMTEAVITMVIN